MGTISRPFSYSAGNTIDPSENNSNENTIYSEFNGSIENANIAAAAAIAPSKIDGSAFTTATFSRGINLTLSSTLQFGTSTQVITVGGSGSFTVTPSDLFSSALNRNHISGLRTISPSASATTNVIINPGECRSIQNNFDIEMSATFTVDISAAGAGGLASGTVTASLGYGIWIHGDSAGTASVTIVFDPEIDASSAPAAVTGRDVYRMISFRSTDSAKDLVSATQSGDYIRYTGDVIQDVADSSITTNTFETATVTVPPNCVGHFYATTSNNTGMGEVRLFVKTSGAADATGPNEHISAFQTVVGDARTTSTEFTCLVSASSEIEYASLESAGAVTVTIRTLGFWMNTRRDP